MESLRVLITNVELVAHTGTVMYVRDLVRGLLARGHAPLVYSPTLGGVVRDFPSRVPIVDRLDRLPVVPDVIHGHHELTAMEALLHFPGVPGLFVCHDRLNPTDIPPRLPRIRRYVAVDDNVRDRLVEHAIPAERIQVVLNAVDLGRFAPRGPLPERPRTALVFSNYASERTHLGVAREACARVGLLLDVIGAEAGSPSARPEAVLGRYDLVFAKGRCALEALAVGAAVVVCDAWGIGSLVTSAELDEMRRLSFGRRLVRWPMTPEGLLPEIARYDARDAALVSRRIRLTAGLDAAVDRLVGLYRDVLAEQARVGSEPDEEVRAVALHRSRSRWRRLRGRLKRVPGVGPLLPRLRRRLEPIRGFGFVVPGRRAP